MVWDVVVKSVEGAMERSSERTHADLVGASLVPTWILMGFHPVESDVANPVRSFARSLAFIKTKQVQKHSSSSNLHACAGCRLAVGGQAVTRLVEVQVGLFTVEGAMRPHTPADSGQ